MQKSELHSEDYKEPWYNITKKRESLICIFKIPHLKKDYTTQLMLG